jgi:hypothetical protein
MAQLVTTPTLQREVPTARKVQHNDPTTQEMEIQIDRAAKLMDRRDLDIGVRMQLLLAIQNARAALAEYRDSISTEEPGMHVSPVVATTTTNPMAGLWMVIVATAAAMVATVPMLDPARRPSAEAAAEALRELAKPVREIETAPRPARTPGPTSTIDVKPLPRTRTRPDEDDRKRKCTGRWGPPAGGNTVHDAYARYVAERHGDPSTATLNYFLADEEGGADFDHFHVTAMEYFEAKTRHEIVMRDWAPNQPLVVARLLDQASKQLEILYRCGGRDWQLIWYFDDPDVVEAARTFLPPIIEVRHEPWPGGERPERRDVP